MNKKRIGFTLAEVLIALVIMGFIATIGFQVMQIQKTSYTSLAYYAYRDIKTVASEIMLSEMQGKVPDNQQMTYFYSRQDGGISSGMHERLFKSDNGVPDNNDPGLAANAAPANSFCNYMAEMMNTQGANNCNRGGANLPNFTYFQAMENSTDKSLDIPDTPHFTTTNGMKYYVGRWQSLDDDYGEYNSADDVIENNSTAYGYRIIAVDLNGDGLPNITNQNNSGLPVDIITFAIVDNGEVLPLGVAANNMSIGSKNYRYLSSKLYGLIYRDVLKEDSGYGKKVPEFCRNTGRPGVWKCNYSKEALSNANAGGSGLFTFRQAYCNTLQFPAEEIVLSGYCDGKQGTGTQAGLFIENRNTRCPCGNTQDEDGDDIEPTCPEPAAGTILYDICKQEVIKPMFRFNFK